MNEQISFNDIKDAHNTKYEQRKELIKTPDEELIDYAIEESSSFQEKSGYNLIDFISRRIEDIPSANLIGERKHKEIQQKRDQFIEFFKGKNLIDIGCGENGLLWANELLLEDDSLSGINVLEIDNLLLVDPFLNENNFNKSLDNMLESEQRERVKFFKQDGLSFLNKQTNGAGNVFMESINYSLIRNDEYLKRIAQEAFRIIPVGGIFLSIDCREIELESEKLFASQLDGSGGRSIIKAFVK